MILQQVALLARQAARCPAPAEVVPLACALQAPPAEAAQTFYGQTRSFGTSGPSCSSSQLHFEPHNKDRLEQQLKGLQAVKRRVQAMAPQNESKNAIKYYRPHQWWYLNPQYYANNPTHNTRIPPYASHECKLRPSQPPRAVGGMVPMRTGTTYEEMKQRLVARSKNGDRNRARRAFNKMWTVTTNMWRDGHNRTLSLLDKQEVWLRRQLAARERDEAWQAWCLAQQQRQVQGETAETFKPSLIQRLLSGTQDEAELEPEHQHMQGALAAPAAAGEGTMSSEQQQVYVAGSVQAHGQAEEQVQQAADAAAEVPATAGQQQQQRQPDGNSGQGTSGT